jgi:outer membrane protein OmpA-like peptidoglycan-associated protein
MKRFIVCTLLVVVFGVYSHAQQFKKSEFAWGLSAGGVHGDNNSGDRWMMQYRGFLQYGLISPMLVGQLGLGYAELDAPDAPYKYRAENFIVDVRLLLSPFSLTNLNPYLYAGFGLSKALNVTGSDFLPMVPFGVGMQTKISSGILLDINGGYSLYLSDDLVKRSNTNLNSLTSGKQDGFYGFTIGLAFTIGGDDESTEQQKKEIAEAEARSAKMQADAEARRIKQQADADAEAKRVRESTNADVKLAKEKADADAKLAKEKADADAKLAKEASDAEARRVKELADAEALRLAAQKGNDTVIVFVKGKTVVLRGVNFEFNKATLTKDSERILWRAYNAMVANPDVRVVITGHTDNVGGQKFNQALSLKRAQAVKNWLVKKGIASNRMRTVGRGLNEPIATNDTDAGRAENRRMEFYVEK